jgi:hypothetical protein
LAGARSKSKAKAAALAKAAASSDGGKKSGKEISTDDHALDKQMDWEAKVLGPNTQKKIDLAKIQQLQAEEMARREKQEKIDQTEKDRKEREAAAVEAAQRNVKAPSSRELPAIPEAPPPAKPAEKHDDAFVDKLLTGKSEKRKVSVSNDEVDQLLNQAKEKPAPGAGKGHGKGADTVDQLLATADKQPTIKTTARKPAETTEPVSAEAAARESTLKAIAAAAKAQEERAHAKRPAVPDAAMLRVQATARNQAESPKPSASRAAWTDPFAADDGMAPRGKSAATVQQAPSRILPASAGRRSPAARPAGGDRWQDPFDSGGGAKARPAPGKAAPAARPGKHPPNWKDPFA